MTALNYDLIKLTLSYIEKNCDGRGWLKIEDEDFRSLAQNSSYDEAWYHMNLLIREGFILGKVGGDGHIIIHDLTFLGHKALDSLRNDALWNKIKKSARSVGIEGLKQIPAIALHFLQS